MAERTGSREVSRVGRNESPPALRGWTLAVFLFFVHRVAWAEPALTPEPQESSSVLDPVRAVFDSEPRAALLLVSPLLQDPSALTPRDRVEALALAARALERLGLPVLGLLHWQQVLLSGNGPWVPEAFHRAAWLATEVKTEAPLLVTIARIDPALLEDPMDREHAFYLKGVGLDADDELSEAVAALSQVSKTHPDHVRARLLMATVLTRMRQRPVAIAILEDLLQDAPPPPSLPPDMIPLVQLTLARALYGAGRVDEAISIYEAFPRHSREWLEVQVELAWAYYRRYAEQDHWPSLGKALGTVHTLNSPFFADWYLPEPALLEAQFLYHLCRFVEGGRVVTDFLDRYTTLRDQLREALSGELNRPGSLLELVQAYRAAVRGEGALPETGVPGPILRRQRNRPSLDELEAHLRLISRERVALETLFGSQAGPAFERLDGLLDSHEQAIRAAYDRSLRGEFQQTLWDLNQLLRQAQLVRLSMTSAEKNLYEAAAAGRLPMMSPSRKHWKRRWPVKNRQVWPFEGEYWVDELGYYESRAVPVCPE